MILVKHGPFLSKWFYWKNFLTLTLKQSKSISNEIWFSETKDKEKPTIRSAIEKIRFLTLTPQQFAEGPARSSLLTESESFAVLMNILSSISDVAMPSGFSMCRVPRKQLIGGGPSSGVRDVGTNLARPRFSFQGPQEYFTNSSAIPLVFDIINNRSLNRRSHFASLNPQPSNQRFMEPRPSSSNFRSFNPHF